MCELASECINAILLWQPARTGGLLILEILTPQESGFYFSTPLDSIHLALENVLEEAVDDHPERVWAELLNVVQQLLLRKQKPYKEMKKLAKRAHLFQLQCSAEGHSSINELYSMQENDS